MTDLSDAEPGDTAIGMVDRVTKASRTYWVRIWGGPHVYAVMKGEEWDGTPVMSGLEAAKAYDEAAKLNAIAILEAMREPTEAMIRYAADPHETLLREEAAYAWRAMIDAALKS